MRRRARSNDPFGIIFVVTLMLEGTDAGRRIVTLDKAEPGLESRMPAAGPADFSACR
jgi:hypothetical protein